MYNDDNGVKFKSGRMYTLKRRYIGIVEDIINLWMKYLLQKSVLLFVIHLLDEGYNTIFKNDKLNEDDFDTYKDALKLSIFCTMKSDLTISDSKYSRDIENFINDNLVNNNNNNNIEKNFGKCFWKNTWP